MCLAVPGQISELLDEGPITRRGIIDFDGVLKEVNLAFVPEALVGDYVVVHVGVAISMIDPDEAERVFEYLEELGVIEQLGEEEEVLAQEAAR
jgi:hydrogenase expression/formation protein HypC